MKKPKWISIREKYPAEKGYYHVKDCRYEWENKSVYYDGYEFEKWNDPSPKGPLILADVVTTHWKVQEKL